MGAVPESIEVSVEVDNRNKKVVAIATGASDLESNTSKQSLTPQTRKQEAQKAFKSSTIELLGETKALFVYGEQTIKKLMLGLVKQPWLNIKVLDAQGTVKLQLNGAHYRSTEQSGIKKELADLLEELTAYGDAGGLLPDVYVLMGSRIVDLSGVMQISQMQALLEQELQQQNTDKILILAQTKN